MNSRKKRALSLLEVSIALTLTAILLTTLFSNLRHIIQNSAKLQKIKEKIYWQFTLRMRLNQIFETLQSGDDKILFYTDEHPDAHPDAKGQALYFTFDNGIDPDPDFCQEITGILLHNKNNELCFIAVSKEGKTRKEVFLKKAKNVSLNFYHPEEKKLLCTWKEKKLPPIIELSICDQTFSFLIAQGNHVVEYS